MQVFELAKLHDESEGLISEMCNFEEGSSKASIRILYENFKLNQETFRRPKRITCISNFCSQKEFTD